MEALYMVAGIVLGIVLLAVIVFSALSVVLILRSFTREKDRETSVKKYLAFLREKGQGDVAERIAEARRAFFEAEKETISITTRDGWKVSGYLLSSPEDVNNTAVLVHGYRSFGADDFGAIFSHYREKRWRVLVIDQRTHGQSEGKYICFGVKERNDLLDWLNYLTERFGCEQKIVLHGISMGAATIMMAQELPQVRNKVSAVIADCGYVTPGQQFRDMFASMHLPYFPLFAISRVITRCMCGFDYFGASSAVGLKNAEAPVLIIHGKKDTFVLPGCSQTNFDACKSEKELYWVDNAEHACSVLVDQPGYFKHIDAFLTKYEL